MSNKFSRWIRSRAGTGTLVGVLAVLLVVAVAGQLLGWWAAVGDLITGTAGPSPPTYPRPEGGYTCLPTCDETDGKFFSMPGEQMASFGGASTILWVSVPADYESFELGFFDGDSGKDEDGNTDWWAGNWDNTTTETTYTLFADPLKDGTGAVKIDQWSSSEMPNNAWFDVEIQNEPEASGPSGHYFYRLEATRPVEGVGINAFKLRSTGYLGSGHADLVDASFALVGMIATPNDVSILYPDFQGDYLSPPGPSNYTGEWQFYAEIPTDTVKIEIWDGDFDRGTSATEDADMDDPNTVGKPAWASAYAVDERAGGRGMPPDDFGHSLFRRRPAVWYEFIDPDGEPIYTNEEPSGTEEWEKYLISTDANEDPDLVVDDIEPGFYGLHIAGLDVHNTVWIRLNYEIFRQPPPPNCDPTCPRTIGYWKNNVKKVLIEGRTKGVQETEESLKAALALVAQYSTLFRSGIDVCNPRPIDDRTPLTAEEANKILQRDYGGCDASSMLARALQQTLATWLNWGSGKICDTTQVELDVHGGLFEGSIWEALMESQDIILKGGDLERAKDIGDQINNGNMGEDADLELTECDITDPDDQNTKAYRGNFPPEKQPPKYEKMKKAPKKDLPDQVETEPQPDPETCEGVRVNQYGVENPTSNPFYGIKFEYQSGTEVKNGDFDQFQFTVTQDEAAAMTAVQMEAKAGQDLGSGVVNLEGCDFTSAIGCNIEPVKDGTGNFAFSFMGAEDNADGTLTLTFVVYNFTEQALSHATVGLPDGVVPSSPSGSYESRICPP